METIGHKEIADGSFYDVSERLAIMIEEARHRGRKILHTSICCEGRMFYASIIWQEEMQIKQKD